MTEKILIFKTRDELLRLYARNIVVFVANGNYTKITLVNGTKYEVFSNLSTIEKVLALELGLDKSNFVRIGKSHIINIYYLQHINVPLKRIILSDGASVSYKINTSRDALRALREHILNP